MLNEEKQDNSPQINPSIDKEIPNPEGLIKVLKEVEEEIKQNKTDDSTNTEQQGWWDWIVNKMRKAVDGMYIVTLFI